MSFSNLFTKLCDVEGAVKDPNHRNDSGQKSSLKRKPQPMQTGPSVKRRCPQPYAAGVSDAVRNKEPKEPEAHRPNRPNWTNNNPRPGVSRDGSYRHNQRTFSSDDQYRGNTNNTQKQKKKKYKGQKKKERAQRHQRGKNQDNTQPRKPFMSQEFKEQHSLEVDGGRLLCIYFLRGRCIKGEECKFEHIEGYNGLIKEVCKFYIQGFCLKGKNCPYLHETFPCKFFHTHGICRREQCMFSHDPLTDLTKKLLENFIQRENELLELRKKAEEEALSQTENVSGAVEENATVEIVIPTTLPSFYQSSAVEEDASMPDEEQPTEEDDPPQVSQTQDNEEPEDSSPSALEQPGPVCYSVEAMLGPKLFKPCFYTAPKSQEAPLSESETTPDSPISVINSPYSVASVLKSSTTSSHLHTPSIAAAVVPTCESNYKQTSVLLDDKYSLSPSVQEKTFKKPPSFYDAATSRYHNKECEKPTTYGSKMETFKRETFETFKAKEQLTIGSSAPNSALKGEKIITERKREYIGNCQSQKYIPLMGSNGPSQKYLTPQVQKDKFGDRERDSKPSHFNHKPALKTNKPYLSKTLPTNQVTIQQNLKETNSETSLKNVAGNRQESVPSPCNKTTRLNSLFASLTPDVDRTSTVRNSVANSGNTDVQSVKQNESDCALKIHSSEAKKQSLFTGNTSENTKAGCRSKNKRYKTERDMSPPAKKRHGLTPNLDRTSTVGYSFRDKPAVPSAQKCEKSLCSSEKINCGSNEASKASQFTGNTSESTNNNSTRNQSKKLISTSAMANSNGSKKEEDIESAKTPPAKSFQSLFSNLIPNSDKISTVSKSLSKETAAASAQKVDKSVCVGQRFNCDSSQALKPKLFSETASESPYNSIHDNAVCLAGASTTTQSNNGQGLITSPATSKLRDTNKKDDIESAKTPPAKPFQSLFTSLTPESDQTPTFSSFGNKPAVANTPKCEKSICASEKISCSNQTAKPSTFTDNISSTNNSSTSNHSKKLVLTSATVNSNGSKKDKNIESDKTPPVKSLQSLFTSLTPDSDQTSTVSACFSKETAASSAQSIRVSPSNKCETLRKNSQEFASASSDLKSKNQQEDVESVKTPVKSFQCLFASLTPDSDRTSTVCSSVNDKPALASVQKIEKSICAGEKVSCGSNKAATPNQFTGNTHKKLVLPSEMTNLKGSKKEEEIESAKPPSSTVFQSIFASLTSDSNQTSTVSSSLSEVKTSISDIQTRKQSGHNGESAAESTVITSCSNNTFGLGAANTDTLSKNCQKCAAVSGLSDFKNQEKEVESVKTPEKSLQSLFASITPEMDQTSTVQPPRYEQSSCDRKFNCDPSPATKQSQYNETMNETLNNNRPKPVSSSATQTNSKEENGGIGSANTPAKSFHNLFAASLKASAVTNDSNRHCWPDLKPSDAKKTSFHASNMENNETVESKNEHVTKTTPANSSNVWTSAPASQRAQQQTNNGSSKSILKSLFQPLRPYEQQVHPD